MKRILHLWLPRFPTDRLTRGPLAEWRDRPMVTVTRAAGGVRVAAVNRAAEAAGIEPGLPAADSQALCPGIKTIAATPDDDAAALARLAEWCQRWSPWTSPEGSRGIWLDVSGCAHLFGGERALVDEAVARVAALGFTIRAGLADTPGAAWAMSHFGDGPAAICPEGAARQWLSAFPVAALRLPPKAAETLRRLGVRRIDQLLALPRAPLVARFGDITALRLDQMLGRASEPIAPRLTEEPVTARISFVEPIGRTADVAEAIRRLLVDVCGRLVTRGLGARRLELKVFRVDGTALAHAIGTGEGVRDPVHLMRLFAEALDGLDCGFGIEAMALTVTAADTQAARQNDIEARPEGSGVVLLVDRLTRRLGPGSVYRLVPRPTHIPESIAARTAPLAPAVAKWPDRNRPVRLGRPHPVKVDMVAGMPVALWRQGIRRLIAAAQGPERIAAEWWHGQASPGCRAYRDYWKVEEVCGYRLWVYQDANARWFLHGTFG